jgi:superfamily II DNA or RNA helicase
MATFSKFIRSIYRDGNDGKQFERFVKWFLKHDPEWSTQVDQIWLWNDWPGRWGIDKGIDLVFKHRNGETWAVQAKCYDQNYYITKEDVDKFLSETSRKSISRRLLIATTNKMGANAKEVCAGQEKPITHFLLADFEKASVEYPSDYKDLRSVKKKEKPKPHGKFEYQNVAVKAVVKGFKTEDRGQLIMACGTGKTFTTLWIKERLKSKNTLVLLPSLNLLAQTVREWTFASKSRIDVLCVCSDKTVGRKHDEDEVIQSVSDVPFPVHSDVLEIRKFLREPGDKVIFSTYQSSGLVADAQKGRGLSPFDLVVADEAHRCAIRGKPDSPFATVLDSKKIRAKKRLFTTATPRTYAANVKKAAENRGVEVIGMDDEAVFGKQFHTLTFGEAIKRTPPLLTDYQVVIVGVDNSMIAEWIKERELVTTETGDVVTDAETLAAQIGLLKAFRDYGLQKVISFHSRVKRAQIFAGDIGAAAEVVDKRHLPKGTIHADYVEGKMSTSDRGDKLKRLKQTGSNEVSLLANARCLSEGVDVPSLDGVAFIDPKNSQVDIIQAVGRAIRLSGEKTLGTIVLPVFIKDGQDAEERIEASNFQPIWWVLNALKAHDEVLVDELDAIRTDMGRRGSIAARSSSIPKIVFDLPATIGASFADALKTQLVEKTTASWNFWFGLLESYATKFRDVHVQNFYRTPDGYKLGGWVSNQRTHKDNMSLERYERLETLDGWVWDTNDLLWEQGFKILEQYVEDEGDALVPARLTASKDFNLGQWVNSQRRKKEQLTKDRRERLEALNGWAWSMVEFRWEEGFKFLEQYVEDNNDAFVPKRHETSEGYKLGIWISTQRSSKEQLTEDRKARLEALNGWVWDVEGFKWEEGFKFLEQYVEDNGDAMVPSNCVTSEDFNLGQWVNSQRGSKEQMTEDRKVRLEALNGWAWSAFGFKWERGFKILKQYVEDEGDALVPGKYVTSMGYKLGNWVARQRRTKDQLTEDQRVRLEALNGWAWEPFIYKWERGFKFLKQYVEDEGDALVPGKCVTSEDFNLGSWVISQRGKKDQLTEDQKVRLEALNGWVWDVLEFNWEEGFKFLKQYVAEKGDALVSGDHETGEGFNLGIWVSTQRYTRNQMSEDRKKRLEALDDWVWNSVDFQWERGFKFLEQYVQDNGDALILMGRQTSDGFNLGNWVGTQRGKKDRLTEVQRERLEGLQGWVWDARSYQWEKSFKFLKQYVAEKGDALVSATYQTSAGYHLGAWVRTQRSTKDKMSKDRVKRLEALKGWTWIMKN